MARRGSVVTRVFVDSSVLFTAVNSLSGGAAKLFTLRRPRLLASRIVLTEVERNVRQKLRSYHLDRFFELVKQLSVVSGLPDRNLVEQAKGVIVEKDAVILAEAKRVGADYLVTLAFLWPKRVVTPKMLLMG